MAKINTLEAAQRLGITPRRVRKLIDDGQLKAQKIGRDWAIDERTLEAFMKRDRPRGRPPKAK